MPVYEAAMGCDAGIAGSRPGPLTPVSASLLFISSVRMSPPLQLSQLLVATGVQALRLRRMHGFLHHHALNAPLVEFGSKAGAHEQLDGYAQAPCEPGWPIVRCRNRTSSVSYVRHRIRQYRYLYGSLS